MVTSGLGPMNELGAVVAPTTVAANGLGEPARPTIRSIQPVRRLDPGAAFSMSSMAAKWERVGLSWPTACTAPNVPAW